MPTGPNGHEIMECQCQCFMETAKDGDLVKTWFSEVPPIKAADGFKSHPLTPCPECGRNDRVCRTSSLPETFGVGSGDTQEFSP